MKSDRSRRVLLPLDRHRITPLVVMAATLWISLACATAAPAIPGLALPTPTANTAQPWAVAQIAKPSPTATATEVAPTTTPEMVSLEIEPTSTQEFPPDRPAESPLITMVIVDQDPQPDATQETSPAPAGNGKYILVSIGEQHLYAYENGQLVYSFVASTGIGNSTRVGTFHVLDKIPNAYGANWSIWMPNWMGIYWSGSLENGIHALPILPGGARLWAGYLGAPISYGCIVLGVDESLHLYDWAEIGTPVEIRW